jgi:hypothetical protein
MDLSMANLSNEGVAASGKRGDVVRLARVIVKDLAQDGHGLIQVVLADGCLGPYPRNQLRAAKTLAVMFDQHEERVKDLGREENGGAVAQKTASGVVQAKRAKLVEVPWHSEDTDSYNNLLLLTCLLGEDSGN